MNASQTLDDPPDPDEDIAEDADLGAGGKDSMFDPDRKCLQFLPPKRLYKACWESMVRQVLEREKMNRFNSLS